MASEGTTIFGVHGGGCDDISCIMEGNVLWEIEIVAVNQSTQQCTQRTLKKIRKNRLFEKKENLFRKKLLAVVGIRKSQESEFFIRSIWWSFSIQLQLFSHGDDDVISAFKTNKRSLSKPLQHQKNQSLPSPK